ncbi:hypothetical protein [uncultured Polaribacter sp.]|uniref:hypothetical protein n=1 Tax=uncultured Polaribacter sp. TaxID=174711 RepID=UPI00261C9EB0|nr:hypothetical protein [uncultured Polaribacter sp.]
MKITKLFALIITSAFIFSSCSNDENLLANAELKNSLKSYKVKRDASGAYSIDLDLEENTKSEKIKNYETNTNEFHLYESDFATSKRQSEELLIDGNQLSVGFIDTRTNRNSNITIKDDNISFAKTSEKNDEMLSEYSITSNEDGTFNLDFTVNNKVAVDFVYNEDDSIYEIHLESGKSKETVFNRNLIKEDGKALRIDFVNHFSNNNLQKGYASKEEVIRRKPRVAVDNGESGETTPS